MDEKVCPNCGYCPHCGKANQLVPQPGTDPIWVVPTTYPNTNPFPDWYNTHTITVNS